jgi:hypothetical protein
MGLAPEDQLLVQCSRVLVRDEAIPAISRLLAKDLDWHYLLEASIRHGVSPLFHHGLQQVADRADVDGSIPPEIGQELASLYEGNRVRNRRLYGVIGEVAEVFEEAGIPVMGLKDIQLGREVYPDVGLRPMGDIDLLIHEEDYERVAGCMAALGFVPLPSPDIPFTRKYAWAHHFHRPADDVWIDMQWNVLQLEWDAYGEGNFDFEIERMWRGASLMAIGDSKISVPRPEDMLFHLCLHLEGHHYAELILFCDIVEFLGHYAGRLDWQYLVGITKKYGVESSLYYVLFLTQRLFGVALPPVFWQELEPTYFRAGVFEALYGNLTNLHISLDEIRRAACPPAEAMLAFEATVRLQAAAAMRLSAEIDQIVSAFVDGGGGLAIVEGEPSERIFADPLLEPFGEIRLFVLDSDLPHLQRVLAERGFEAGMDTGSEAYEKRWEVVSQDPALMGRRAELRLLAGVVTEIDGLLEPGGGGGRSKQEIALNLLKARARGHQGVYGDIPVALGIKALSPEDMLVYLAGRLGRQEQNRLFGLCFLLEFFRCYVGPIDWQQVARRSEQYGIGDAVGEGLQIASELVDDEQLPAAALALCAGSASLPRIFEWARYRPVSPGLYTDLKGLFLYMLSLVSLDGLKAKSKYLLRSLWGYPGNRLMLPRLVIETGTSMVAQIWKRPAHTTTSLAFWVEPGVRSETMPGNKGQP